MTEKDYNPKQKEKKAIEKQSKKVETLKEAKSPIKEKQKENLKVEDKKKIGEDKKKKQTPKVKKTEALVNSFNLPISTKDSVAICRFIKNKKIEKAITDLEQVLMHKKAIPMKGEIPHRKGTRIMSGRYPKKAIEYFIKLLKSLLANSNTNGLNNPTIVEAVANIASRPFGRFGRVRKKRTHVSIKAKEVIKKKKEEKLDKTEIKKK